MPRPHGMYFLASAVAHAAVFSGLTGQTTSPPPAAEPLHVHLRALTAVSEPRPTVAELPRPSRSPQPAAPRPSHKQAAPSLPSPPQPSPAAQPAVAPAPSSTPTSVSASAPTADAQSAPPPAPREQIALARPQVPVAVTETSQYPDPDLVASYARNLSAGVARLKRYPAIARMRGWQGTAVINVSIGPRGELLDARIARSSGFAVLDEQALEMIREAQPLPPAPASLRGLALVVQLPVSFSLTR